jgi:hypothetical protein
MSTDYDVIVIGGAAAGEHAPGALVPDARGIPVDAHLRAGWHLWAISEPLEEHCEALPRVTFTGSQAAAVVATEDRFGATVRLSDVAKTATYTRAYADSNGYFSLPSDADRLTGAHALGPDVGEWPQQATRGICARAPLDILRDTIQPFPTFSKIYVAALQAPHSEISSRQPVAGAAS